jgi:hypothetical protein
MAKHIYKPEGASEKSRLSFSSISSRAALLRSASSQWANPRSWKTLNTIHGPVHVVKAVVSNLKSAVLVAMVQGPVLTLRSSVFRSRGVVSRTSYSAARPNPAHSLRCPYHSLSGSVSRQALHPQQGSARPSGAA